MNPGSFEDSVSGHPDRKGALLYGQGRVQSAILIEAKLSLKTEAERKELSNKLWPLIQQANSNSPAYGRVMQEMILFVSPEKPLPRPDKGTIQRRLAYEMYSVELSALYEKQDMPVVASESPSGEGIQLKDEILKAIHAFPGLDRVTAHTNLFDVGLDSLQVLTLARRIKACLKQIGIPSDDISNKLIYALPTVKALVARLLNEEGIQHDPLLEMETLYESYTSELPVNARPPKHSPEGKHTVILTGSTSSLGAYILDKLLLDESVRRIYCLNRDATAGERQKILMAAKGLSSAFNGKEVKFFQANFSKPYFGMSLSNYTELLGVATLVIHNAWAVDFNQPLERLASTHIRGVRQFIDFSSRSALKALILFVSSSSAVASWIPGSKTIEAIPEEIIESWEAAADTGYSRAKLVAERILAAASVIFDIPAAVVRVGQIAEPSTHLGEWPKQEWLPSILASSKIVGKLPSTLGYLEVIDWVPVDAVASAVLSLAKSSSDRGHDDTIGVYHIVNPRKTTWSRLLPTIQKRLDLDTVSPLQWLQLVRQSSSTEVNSEVAGGHAPALKFIEFFEGAMLIESGDEIALPLAADKTIKACSSIEKLGAINGELMNLWFDQWKF